MTRRRFTEKDGLRKEIPLSTKVVWIVLAIAVLVTATVLVFRAFQPAEVMGAIPPGAGDNNIIPAGPTQYDSMGRPVVMYSWNDTLIILAGMLSVIALMGLILLAFFKHQEKN